MLLSFHYHWRVIVPRYAIVPLCFFRASFQELGKIMNSYIDSHVRAGELNITQPTHKHYQTDSKYATYCECHH